MNALQAIREALEPIGVPVELAPYDGGDESTYIVYRVTDTYGADWSDDDAGAEISECVVYLCCPLGENPSKLSRKMKKLIREKEYFTYPRMVYDQDPEGKRRPQGGARRSDVRRADDNQRHPGR